MTESNQMPLYYFPLSKYWTNDGGTIIRFTCPWLPCCLPVEVILDFSPLSYHRNLQRRITIYVCKIWISPPLDQNLSRSHVTIEGRKHERTHAERWRPIVDVVATVDQMSYDVVVSVKRGDHYGREFARWAVDRAARKAQIDSIILKQLARLEVSATRRKDHCVGTEVRYCVDVRLVLQQQCHNGRMAVSCGLQKRSPTGGVRFVERCTFHYQQPNKMLVAVGRCHLQRRHLIVVRYVDVNSFVENGRHHPSIAFDTSLK